MQTAFDTITFSISQFNIKTSFRDILPRSPCKQSFADKENAGHPIEDNVEAILDAINPLLPTPQSIIFDWQLIIVFTA